MIKIFVNLAIASTIVMYITAGKIDFAAFQWVPSFSMNYIFASANEVPIFFDWWASIDNPNFNPHDPNNYGNKIRNVLPYFGLNAVPGAGSVYLTMLSPA